MRTLALALVTLGTLAASFETVREPTEMRWALYGGAMVAAVAGVAMLSMTRRRARSAGEHVRASLATLREVSRRLAERTSALGSGSDAVPASELPDAIDARLREDLAVFASARESLAIEYGVQTYADVMSRFAAGERYLGRVWSSASDGYHDEARKFLALAAEQFERVARDLTHVSSSR